MNWASPCVLTSTLGLRVLGGQLHTRAEDFLGGYLYYNYYNNNMPIFFPAF